MISLVLLPAALIFYLQYHEIFRAYNMIRVFRITEDFYRPQTNNSVVYSRPPDYDNLCITLDGDDDNDRVKLEYARLTLRQIIAEKDTAKGVYFKFASTSKYGAFVRAITFCKLEKADFFITLKNDIQAYCRKPEPQTDRTIVVFMQNCIMESEEAKIQKEKAAQTIRDQQENTFIAGFWPVWLFFGVWIWRLVSADNFRRT
jgi:hypothetical protein